MIRQLRAESAVYCSDEMQVICGESDLSAVRQVRIFYLESCSASGKFFYTLHIGAVKGERSGKIARSEFCCQMLQMLLD
jgi:hypothetical protein